MSPSPVAAAAPTVLSAYAPDPVDQNDEFSKIKLKESKLKEPNLESASLQHV